MVLATEPEVLLLDEPLAGMGAEESRAMVALLRKLKTGHAILLVEHDMDAIFAVADVITVMVDGRVLETGAPATIRSSPAVDGGLPRPCLTRSSRLAGSTPSTARATSSAASTSRSTPARSSASWAGTGWARPRSSARSSASCAPAAARCRVRGEAMTGAPPYRIARRGIAYVPEGRGIFPNLDVRENLVMVARARPSTAGATGRFARALADLPAPRASGSRTAAASSPAASSRC